MKYKKIKISIKNEKADLLEGLLLDFNVSGFEIIDNKPIYNEYESEYEELRPDLADMGDRCFVIFYLGEDDDETDILQEIQKSIEDVEISISLSDEEDWRDKWKDYFHSFSIGDILIKPSWEDTKNSSKIVLEIDPGISFGTGGHETTRMCIGELASLDLSEKRVLDAGCGSGILSIAANKLGSNDVTCIDIDSDCITTTKENIKNNNCNMDFFTFYLGDVMTDDSMYAKLPDKGFDVVVANILADIIVTMLPRLVPKIKKGGIIITSGIIEGKEKKVIEAFSENKINDISFIKDGEWYMVRGKV